jgi:hypothetical protein
VKGVRFVTFCYFFTGCNFDKLLFTVEKGQGLYCVCDCARGELERVQVDFFPSFFLLLKGRSVTMDDIIYVPLRLDFGYMEAPWQELSWLSSGRLVDF